MAPFFSIITCTYNSAEFLADNLKSLADQDCRDFEHIFIDGNSTDSTLKLINDYLRRFPKQVKLYSYPPQGISDAMNKGIEHATGKYLLHLHSDDYLHHPTVLSQVKEYISAKHLPWVYGQINTLKNDQPIGVFPARWFFQTGSRFLLSFFNYIPHQAVFVSRKLFKEIGGFNTSYHICMDYDLWLRLAKKYNPAFMPVIVTSYRLHSHAASSAGANLKLANREYRQVQSMHGSLISRILVFIVNPLVFVLNRRLAA